MKLNWPQMTKTKAQWEKQRREANEAISDIEDAARIKRNAGLLGRCFRAYPLNTQGDLTCRFYG